MHISLVSHSMPPSQHTGQLDAVARHLPFSVTDFDEANGCFSQWHATRDPKLKRHVDLWVYLYVCKYFLMKFAREPRYNASDFDALVEETFTRMERNYDSVREPDRFVNWASVICKRVFCNYVRAKQVPADGEPDDFGHEDEASAAFEIDAERIRVAVHNCINGLQPYMQRVARLKFEQDLSYDEIADTLGKEVSTVRAYAHRAMIHLRQDPRLRAFVDDIVRRR